MPRSVAIYPGTFDPITNGHVDMIKRGLQFFDQVILAIAPNPGKEPLFTLKERLQLSKDALAHLPGAEVESFEGLLVEYVQKKKAKIIIRGLRAVSDFEYEFQMALMNRKLAPHVETIYMMPSEAYTFLSSHVVKEVSHLGGNVSSLVPRNVEMALKKKFGKK